VNAVRGLPFAADDPRYVPRRKRRERYRGLPLSEERIAAFFAAQERIRERAVRPVSPWAGNAGEFRKALEAHQCD
jgi:hypothetical protein